MKEGVYVFRFGMNQTKRFYYFHNEYRLEIDPSFSPNVIENLSSPISQSTEITFQLKNKNYEYCVKYVHDIFESDLNLIKDAIKCEILPSYLFIENSSDIYNGSVIRNIDQYKTFPCKWKWNKTSNAISVFLMPNDTFETESKLSDEVIEESSMYIPSLTCEMHQYVSNRGGLKKRIKFAKPFYYKMLDMINPSKVSILNRLKAVISSPWTALLAIPVLGITIAVLFYYRRQFLQSKKLG